jgi:hypothetical protein
VQRVDLEPPALGLMEDWAETAIQQPKLHQLRHLLRRAAAQHCDPQRAKFALIHPLDLVA